MYFQFHVFVGLFSRIFKRNFKIKGKCKRKIKYAFPQLRIFMADKLSYLFLVIFYLNKTKLSRFS